MPAPPLRTLSSRPREPHEKPEDSPPHDDPDDDLETINNNSQQVDFNKKTNVFDIEQKPSMFTPGKLADVAQMGGLSSLLAEKTEAQTMNPYYSSPTYKANPISEDRPRKSRSFTREDNIRELQNALSETTRVFEDFDEDKGTIYRREVHNPDFTHQDMIDQIVDKRYNSKEDEYAYQKQWSDDEKYVKSGRSCKGKRYQEFMAVGGLIVNKRQKRDKSPEDPFSASCSWEQSRNEERVVEDHQPNHSPIETSLESETTIETDEPEPDNNANKTFKAADFDLDAKIRALPSLSLEKFQQKKRENKRKKKTVNLRPKMPEHTVKDKLFDRREMAESYRENIIGSQKRKPRKISITRLEINSLVSSVDLNRAHKISPELKIATEAPCTVVQNMDVSKHSAHDNTDLFALATLAEVAANTSKMEETSMLEKFTSQLSGDFTSKV